METESYKELGSALANLTYYEHKKYYEAKQMYGNNVI